MRRREHASRLMGGFILATLACTVASCGPSRPKVDDTAFVEQISSSSNSVRVWLGNIDPSNKPLIALFMKAGYVSVVQNASGPPWWHFNVTGGQVDGNAATFVVGHMVIDDRTDQREWKDGAADNFAETLKLHFEPNDKLKPFVTEKIGPFVVRLVLVNDPAVGQWQLSDRSQAQEGADPRQAITKALTDAGTELEPLVDDAIYDAIEAGEAAAGIIERSKADRNVLVSRNNNLAYYVKPNGFTNTTVGALRQYCAAIRVPGFSDWHVPSRFELATVFPHDNQPGTPRLWGTLFDGQPEFLTSTFVATGNSAINYGVADRGNRFFDTSNYSWAESPAVGANGYISMSAIRNGYVDPAVIDKLAYSSNRPMFKVICMAWIVAPVENACRSLQTRQYRETAAQAESGCSCVNTKVRTQLDAVVYRTLNRYWDAAMRSGLKGNYLTQEALGAANYEHLSLQAFESKANSAVREARMACHLSVN